MSIPLDLELKRAFTELQQKMIDTTQKLRIADVQIDSFKRNKQYADITEREISALEPGTKMYESVGRAFILTPLPIIKANLDKKRAYANEKIAKYENNKVYLERNLKESENNIREMVAQRKQMTS